MCAVQEDSGKDFRKFSGRILEERLLQPVAWGHCQLDLFGPFKCHVDVNPRMTKKVWSLAIEDMNLVGV